MIKPRYFKYLGTIAIALSLQLGIKAQVKSDPDPLFSNFQDRLASEWENAVKTQVFPSTTEINTIKFSPDGNFLASVGASQITIWDVDKGRVRRILPGHYATESGMKIAPTAIAFSPDGNFLATSTWSQGLLSPKGSITVWDTTTGEELSIEDRSGCRQVLFDVSGEILYGACEFGVTAWSFPEGEKLFSFDTEYPVEAIALSPDGKVMATVDANVSGGQGEQSNKIQLWQLDPQPALLNTLDGHANDIAQLEFTADGERLVSSSYDGKIKVWNWQQGTTYRNTSNLYSKNGVFSLSANSRLIAGNFHSSTMANLITGLPLDAIAPSKTSIVAFSPQQQLLAIVKNKGSDTAIDFWQPNTQPEIPSTRDNYLSIPVTEYWGDRSFGKEPMAIALSALGLNQTDESEPEVELDYHSDNLATVTITQTDLLDDSVAAIRYLVEFAPYGDEATEQWQVVWAGQQFKCQLGRGHQDWG